MAVGDEIPGGAVEPAQAQAWHRLAIALVGAGKLAEARDALQRTLALDPGSSEARNNLGIVLQRLGDPQGARAQYEAALALAPENAGLHANLAAALALLGHYEAGLEAARRAIALDPQSIGAHVHAALIEKELGRLGEALQRIERIPAAAADAVEILLVRADLLGRLDRVEEALALCRRAVALRPADGTGYNLLGLQLQALGRDEEALDAFARAAALLALPGDALANQATVLGQLGRSAEARAALDRALALQPFCVAAWYARALTKRYAAGDPDLDAMEAILGENRAPGYNERLCLHFALGGAYLGAGEGGRAFAHLAEGARMKRALLAYDGTAAEDWMREIAAAFPAEMFAREEGHGLDGELPVFVVGMPRSGTTLVEQVLASHPCVQGAGEVPALERAVGRVLASPDPRAFPRTFAPRHCAAIARDYLAQLAALSPGAARRPGALRIVDKMMSNLVYAGLIHLMLPRARIILCRRDPVDTCLSCYSKLFARGLEYSYDLVELGRYFRAQDALARHWRRVLPPEIFLEVEYESVVADLEAAARRLVRFCGLEWSPSCLAFHQTRRPVRTASMIEVRRPIYRTSVGRWRHFRTELAPLLEALGVSAED